MLDWIVQQDQALLLFLNGSNSAFLDGVFWTSTKTVTWLPLFLGILYMNYRSLDLRRFFIVLISVALLIFITDMFASAVCKPLFQRLRPTHNPEISGMVDVVRGYRGGMYGFISSHASNTFGLAVFFILFYRNRIVSSVLISWAVLCSYSRIYLGVHYPGDIFFGALWGVFSAFVVYCLCRNYRVSKLREQRMVPLAFIVCIVYVIARGLLWI